MEVEIIIFVFVVSAVSVVAAFLFAFRSRNEVKGLIADKAKLGTELGSVTKQLKEASAEAETARQLEVRKASLEQEIKNVNNQLDGLKADKYSSDIKVDKLQAEIRSVDAEKTGLERDLKNIKEQLGQRDDLQNIFKDQFQSLSSETLKNQHDQFIQTAKLTLKPLAEKVDKLDTEWTKTSGAFNQQITMLASETKTLSSALSKPHSQGKWGEMQVERALQLSGLEPRIHYDTQESDNQGGRTDFIVHLAHNRDIILDSKVSLVAILGAEQAETEEDREQYLNQHAKNVQIHIDGLSKKEYWNNLPDSADFVAMVMPEFALPPAVIRIPNLLDRALQNNVVVVTYSMLVALLKCVAMGWQERKVANEARNISVLGKNLHDRLATFAEHVDDMGRALGKAVDSYNAGIRSMETRLLPQARRFKELGVPTAKELPELEPIDKVPQALNFISQNGKEN